MTSRFQIALLLPILGGITITAGCGRDSDQTVPVSGFVLVDGLPLAGAGVFFIAADATGMPRPAHGTTDADGRYVLFPGAVPGPYRVIVRGFRGGRPEQLIPGIGADGVDEGQLAAATSARSHSRDARPSVGQPAHQAGALPDLYSSPDHSVLCFDVPEGGTTTADLHLALEMLAADDRPRDVSRRTALH